MDQAKLEQTIQQALKYKLVPILELHDATGSKKPEDLISCAQWWAQKMPMLLKYQKNLILNIANEWVLQYFIRFIVFFFS